MTTHSSTLAWKIPWIEEPGRLQSMGSQRVRHDWATSLHFRSILSFPGGSYGKASACSAGDLGSIPGLGRSPGEGNGNPFQYSVLENSADGGAWQAIVQGVTKSQTWLSNFTILYYIIAIFICTRDFKSKTVRREREDCYIMIKESIHQMI